MRLLLVDDDATIRWNAAWTLGKIGPAAKAALPDLARAARELRQAGGTE